MLSRSDQLTFANPKQIWQIRNAHRDDIHAMKLFRDGFVSGSKDGCVYAWDRRGQLTQTLYERTDIDYTQWVTAIGANKTHLIVATRDGILNAWNVDGKRLNKQGWRFRVPTRERTIAKRRNINRVNCITTLPQDPDHQDTFFYLGGPSYLHLVSVSPKGFFTYRSSSKVHDNDWVYCMQPQDPKNSLGNLIVAIGAQMDLLVRDEGKDPYQESAWNDSVSIVQENEEEVGFRNIRGRKRQVLRPHIASMVLSPTNANHIAYACFENKNGFGPIRIVDAITKKIIFDGQEHKGRSWDLTYVQPWLLASGSDDQTVKLWDVRLGGLMATSQYTFPKHPGRVSCLLSPKENLLMTASCPDNLSEVEDMASITLFDVRVGKPVPSSDPT